MVSAFVQYVTMMIIIIVVYFQNITKYRTKTVKHFTQVGTNVAENRKAKTSAPTTAHNKGSNNIQTQSMWGYAVCIHAINIILLLVT